MILTSAALLLSATLFAQTRPQSLDPRNPLRAATGLRPTAQQVAVLPPGQIELRLMPEQDLTALALEDASRDAAGLPRRFAVPNEVMITPATDGTWEQVDGDTWLWRLRIVAPGARSINLGFTRYHMPGGGTLFVGTTDEARHIRAFTAADNEAHGQLWTPPLETDDLMVEVTLPAAVKDQLQLELTRINHGYRNLTKDAAYVESGACNVDVTCPEGDPWQDEIRAVAVYSVDGLFHCTGTMVNNTAGDRTPFLLTAEHCGVDVANVASVVVFWNYQNSTCRTPGGGASGLPGDGVLDQFNSGAIHRAEYIPSDVTLVELDDDPDPVFGANFAGWSRDAAAPSSAVCIHHPNLEEKRISFEDNPLSTTAYSSDVVNSNGTHLRVADWDLGTTEGGSSGAALFDPNHRIVGQLHGGPAECGNDLSDWFGRLFISWTGGGTPGTRLRDWLDPLATGAVTTDTLGALIDCDLNGLHDPDEIAAMPTLDCQGNGVLDACELGSSINAPFDSFSAELAKGWEAINNSSLANANGGWGAGAASAFPAHTGSPDSYATTGYLATNDGVGIEHISDWLITPEVELVSGEVLSFWTRGVTANNWPDRMDVRMSTNGSSTDVGAAPTNVGDFTTLLGTINPTLVVGGYPEVWTNFQYAVPAVAPGTTGRFAFRYWVEDGGPSGANSNLIGVDTVTYASLSNDQNGDGVPDDCLLQDPDGLEVGISGPDTVVGWAPVVHPSLDGYNVYKTSNLELLSAGGAPQSWTLLTGTPVGPAENSFLDPAPDFLPGQFLFFYYVTAVDDLGRESTAPPTS